MRSGCLNLRRKGEMFRIRVYGGVAAIWGDPNLDMVYMGYGLTRFTFVFSSSFL